LRCEYPICRTAAKRKVNLNIAWTFITLAIVYLIILIVWFQRTMVKATFLLERS
jgi:hypothetical protein